MCLQSTKLMQPAVIKSKIAIFIIKVKLKVTKGHLPWCNYERVPSVKYAC